MAKTTFIYPYDSLVGTINHSKDDDKMIIHRIRRNVAHRPGEPNTPVIQTYIYHKHQGEWSTAVEANRERFRQAQRQARTELADPERKAYWSSLYEDHRKNCPKDEKFYSTILGFVSARILADLKNAPSA